ncbi:hypothetical protein MJO28_016448 [Puccinia striiformis f. sp. tritici]|uniref:Uncharacterized protein n=1 Tax=Puccinia striiformis f. sp. tritici TaxID=168172 RepID=A0ACC0DN91_9BASI|nr:hypothetical protein MJO29_016185 [Puccinia striiformis f. sp. tritici]KAI7935577.1 hypothetical protein MJO28_016448 [Puccinia striiformis f. sp. tritici]
MPGATNPVLFVHLCLAQPENSKEGLQITK